VRTMYVDGGTKVVVSGSKKHAHQASTDRPTEVYTGCLQSAKDMHRNGRLPSLSSSKFQGKEGRADCFSGTGLERKGERPMFVVAALGGKGGMGDRNDMAGGWGGKV